MIGKLLLPCLAALVPSLATTAPAQAFRIRFDVQRHSEMAPRNGAALVADKPPPIPPDTTTTLAIVLGTNRVLFDEGRHRLFDFEAGVARVLAPDGSTWDELPLLAFADQASAELHNRSMMRGVLRIADAKGPEARSCEPFELACLFSLDPPAIEDEDEPPAPVLEPTPQGFTLKQAEETVTEVTWSATRVPEALRGAWRRALQLRLRVHPVVRRRLGEAEFLPSTIRSRTLQMDVLVREDWTLRDSAEADIATLELPAGAVRKLAVADGLRDALEAARAAAATPEPVVKLEDYVVAAIAAGRVLDAGLASFEQLFVTGAHPATLKVHHEELVADTAFRTLVTSMDMSSKEACEQSLARLTGLDRTGLEKAWVLDIFIGNMRLALGESEEGRALLLSALKHNPRLVGVWNDLGDSYLRNWAIEDVWRCWSTALALSPDHPMLAAVRVRISDLQEQGPDFF